MRSTTEVRASSSAVETSEVGNNKLLIQLRQPSITEALQKCPVNHSPHLETPGLEEKAGVLFTEDQNYVKQIEDLHAYLDMVKNMVRPGCSQEMLKVALNSMSSLFNILSFMSSMSRPHAAL